MSTYDWSRFKRSIFIDVTPDKVFDAWVIPEQIETWFLKRADFTQADGSARPKDAYIAAGDSYSWNWWNYEETEENAVTLVDRESRHLEFKFAGDCTVIVHVEERAGDTFLRLEQKNIPLDEQSQREIHMGCGQGWAFWMVNLKSWLEHGIVLHDFESQHKNKDFGFCELINR